MDKNATHYDEAINQINDMFDKLSKEIFENDLSKSSQAKMYQPRNTVIA